MRSPREPTHPAGPPVSAIHAWSSYWESRRKPRESPVIDGRPAVDSLDSPGWQHRISTPGVLVSELYEQDVPGRNAYSTGISQLVLQEAPMHDRLHLVQDAQGFSLNECEESDLELEILAMFRFVTPSFVFLLLQDTLLTSLPGADRHERLSLFTVRRAETKSFMELSCIT